MRQSGPLSGGGNLPSKNWVFDGWNLGVNNFSLATELKGNELAQASNFELFGKRSVRPRRGSEKLGIPMDGDSVDGLFQFKDGDDVNEILGISAGKLSKYNLITKIWDDIAGGTFTLGKRTRGVKLRGNLYFGNGDNDFTRYDGLVAATFEAVDAPSGLTVTPQGTVGTTTYSYMITAVTDKGESLPCTQVDTNTGNAVLDTTNKNRLVFNRRTESQVVGYNIYGRKTTGMGITLMKYIDQVASGATITYDDTGSDTPQIWLPPEGDSTDGPSLTMWEQLRGSLVGAGDINSPHRLYFSGTGERYESFSPAHNGGWVDVRPGDNDKGVNGFAPFESKIIVLKERSIHNFTFSATTGDAVIGEILTYVGCGAPGSVVVMENDIAFIDSERKLRVLGYEPNFSSSIRTSSLSEGRTQDLFNDISPDYLYQAEAVYFQGRYILAYTPVGSIKNERVIIYDRKYLSFLGMWDGADCHVRCWLVWDGKDKKQRLFAGSSDTGDVFEFNIEGRLVNHDNTIIHSIIRTRNEDLGNSGQSKLWKWVDLRIFRATGTIKLKTILNGATTFDERAFSSIVLGGIGLRRWGMQLWGEKIGESASASNLDKTFRKEIYEIANSLQYEISKNDAVTDFVLVLMRGEALMLPPEVFNSSDVI